tara:strand:- start:37670 stop:39208 length:1539 start_codon:yes stop_codon:yes gene_type:complete
MLQKKYALGHEAQIKSVLYMISRLFLAGSDLSLKLRLDQRAYLSGSDDVVLMRDNDPLRRRFPRRYLEQRRIFAIQEILRCFSEYPSRSYSNAHIYIGQKLLSQLPPKPIEVSRAIAYTGYMRNERHIDAGGEQSAHFKSAHEAAGQAILRLSKRYPNLDAKQTLLDLYRHLMKLYDLSFKQKLPYNMTRHKINVALRYLACIGLIPLEGQYKDMVTQVTEADYIALIWQASKHDFVYIDETHEFADLGMFQPGTEDFLDRLCEITNELVNIGRAYNVEVDNGLAFRPGGDVARSFDNPTCWGGAFTKIHSILMGKHPDVPIEYLSYNHRDLAGLRKEVFQGIFNSLHPYTRALVRAYWSDNPYKLDDYIHTNEKGLFSKVADQASQPGLEVGHDDALSFLIHVNHALRAEIENRHGIQGENAVAVVPKDVADTAISIYALGAEILPDMLADENTSAVKSFIAQFEAVIPYPTLTLQYAQKKAEQNKEEKPSVAVNALEVEEQRFGERLGTF